MGAFSAPWSDDRDARGGTVAHFGLRPGLATRRRLAASAAVLSLAALSVTASTSPALADRIYPSAGQVAASKAQVATKSHQVGAIEAQLAAASARQAQLALNVAQAVEAYNGARFRLQQAIADSIEAQQKADLAKAGVVTSQRDLGAFAAAAYRSGGDLTALSAFLTAQGPRDLISRAAALASIGANREDALYRLTSAQAVSRILQKRADDMVTKRQQAADAVTVAKQAAESRLADQQQAVGEISAQRGSLVSQLAAAQHTSVSLERARQAGIAAAQAAAAARAAAAQAKRVADAARRAREEAARQAASRSANDHSSAGSSAGGGSSDSASGSGSGGGSPDSGGPSDSGGGLGGGGLSGGNSSPAPGGSSQGSTAGAQAAIDFARAQIGKPYQWAADGPDSFDCSGLTMRAWQQGGVGLPHFAAAQYGQSEKIALGDLRPGDLVFFGSDKADYQSIYHVGLYIGGGDMIEAPFTGENVRISSIWRSSLFGAARP
jgi:cell wall-associated NlpC family hydrolase